jgi:hypothetical protein
LYSVTFVNLPLLYAVYSAYDIPLVSHFQHIAGGCFSFSSFLYYIFHNLSLVHVVLALVVVNYCTLEAIFLPYLDRKLNVFWQRFDIDQLMCAVYMRKKSSVLTLSVPS